MTLHHQVHQPVGDFMLFQGRLTPTKGAVTATEVAAKTNHPLKVIAMVDSENEAYNHLLQTVFPKTSTKFLGELPHQETIPYLQKEKLFLLPVNYEDPCPLTPLEAMASGTPVVSFALGALPEEIEDGKSGGKNK